MNGVKVNEYSLATINDLQLHQHAHSYGRHLLQVLSRIKGVLWFCVPQPSYNFGSNKSTCHIKSEMESLLRS